MPDRLSIVAVALCVVLAGAVFGGAYALAHDSPARPAPKPASPTAIQLKDEPIGELARVRSLPALIVPPPQPEPVEPEPAPVVEEQPSAVSTPAPQVSTPAPEPTPTPEPAPDPKPAPAKKPLTFDDSG